MIGIVELAFIISSPVTGTYILYRYVHRILGESKCQSFLTQACMVADSRVLTKGQVVAMHWMALKKSKLRARHESNIFVQTAVIETQLDICNYVLDKG